MNKKLNLFVLFSLILSLQNYALSGKQIMELVKKEAEIHKNMKSNIIMKIVSKKNKERKRTFFLKKKIIISSKKKETKSLIKFTKPSSVKHTGLLTHNIEGKEKKNQWIYLPALKSVRRLGSSDKNKSFMGSDFTFSDIAGRTIDQDSHKKIDESNKIYIVESIPKDKKDIYSKIVYEIDKKLNIPITIKFYNQKGDLLKILENSKIENIEGMNIAKYAVMKNKLSNGYTILEINTIDVTLKISNNDVGMRALNKKI